MDAWLTIIHRVFKLQNVFTKKVLLKVLEKVWHSFGVYLLVLVLPILFSCSRPYMYCYSLYFWIVNITDQVQWVVIHKLFPTKKFRYDMMLVQLRTSIQFDDKTTPICVDGTRFPPATRCFVTGWGSTNPKGKYTSNCIVIRLTVFSVITRVRLLATFLSLQSQSVTIFNVLSILSTADSVDGHLPFLSVAACRCTYRCTYYCYCLFLLG